MSHVTLGQLSLGLADAVANGGPTRTDRPRAAPKGTRGSLRLALSPDEAAAALGVSRDYLDEHVIGELRIVRRGRRILIALAEVERWLERSSAR